MHRAVLEAILPCLAALAIACAVLLLLIRISGARFDWRRLASLHRCQDGGVQSLAFVITLPIFLMIVQFIVQVSQLMNGIMVVHYAAFSAARSAVVWLPAEVGDDGFSLSEPQNQIGMLGIDPARTPLVISADTPSYKLSRIRTAAVLGCAPIAPSRDLGLDITSASRPSQFAADAVTQLYRSLVPSSVKNGRINARLLNKIAYSDLNTTVQIEWRDASDSRGTNTVVGPTYNPLDHPLPNIVFRPNEIGWQDAITVRVVHQFALFPGPGRFLAPFLVRDSGNPVVEENRTNSGRSVFTVAIPASATLTNDGLKSVRPYVHQTN